MMISQAGNSIFTGFGPVIENAEIVRTMKLNIEVYMRVFLFFVF